jgi:hypothetical protein
MNPAKIFVFGDETKQLYGHNNRIICRHGREHYMHICLFYFLIGILYITFVQF